MHRSIRIKFFPIIYILILIAFSICLFACNKAQETPTEGLTDSPTDDQIIIPKPTEKPSEKPAEPHVHTLEDIPSIAATCTQGGSTAGKKCADCGEVVISPVDTAKLPHTPETVAGVQASCTSTGLTDGSKCSVCGDVLTERQIIEKLDHIPSEEIIPGTPPSCTESGVSDSIRCEICGEYTLYPQAIYPLGHYEEFISGYSPTCTENGLTSGKKCSVCKEWTQPQTIISATGHTEQISAGTSPTCTESGLSDGKICAICNITLLEQESINALGHRWDQIYKYDINSHWQICSVCNVSSESEAHTYGSNNACLTCGYGCQHPSAEWRTLISPTCYDFGIDIHVCHECGATTDIQTTAKLPHTPGAEASCTEAQTCTVCGEIIAKATGHSSSSSATCTQDEICTVCGKLLSPATGHTPGAAASCTEAQICTICNETLIKAKGHAPGAAPTCLKPQICLSCGVVLAAAKGHSPGDPATCTTAQRCTVCNEIIKKAKGHVFNIENATCTQNKFCTVCNKEIEKSAGHMPGETATCTTPQLCTVCNEILVAATGHTIVTDAARTATCTQNGLTEGQHCVACESIFIAQFETPAMGHNYKYSMCVNCKDMISPDSVQKNALPRLDVTTNGGAAINSKDIYTQSTITLSGCDEEFEFTDISAGIRLRGNSTMYAAKKPYRIKFDSKRNMLGLNNGKKFKSWVLLADYFDSSMLRTHSTFSMAKILLEGKYFSSDCTPVEVYINGAYQGVYLLCEQSQINKNRVNIYEREDTDTSVEIGYLLIGQGGRTDEPNSVVIKMNMSITDRNGAQMYIGGGNFSLSGGDYTEEQMNYVETYLAGVYKVIDQALHHNTYYTLDRQGNLTPKTDFVGTTEEEKQIETIDAVFNIDACVRLCILDELVKNLDAGTYNMYVDLSPEGDGRLTLGPPWDFDFALANTGYSSTHSTTGFYATNFSYSDGMRVNTVFVLFGKVPWFEEMVKEVWQEHVDELYAVANNIRVMTAAYGDYYQTDYAHWNRSLIGHHCTDCQNKFNSHADASDFLANWLYKRIAWLDSKWGVNTSEENKNSIMFDFTDYDVVTYQLKGFHDCYGTLTDSGFLLQTYEAYDPYFTVDFSTLEEAAIAEDYPYVEIEYMIPETNSNINYTMELFLCAGNTLHATAGRSVTTIIGPPDGQWKKIRISLCDSEYWTGEIHSIRMDYFASCSMGDMLYIRSVNFIG